MSGRRVSDTAIACLLCGIGNVAFGCIGLPLGVAAVVTGIVALAEIRSTGSPGSRLVIAGAVSGVVGILLCLVMWTVWGVTLVSGILGLPHPLASITNS
jgi:hypothetical protein